MVSFSHAIFVYLLSLIMVQSFKKSLELIPRYKVMQFWAQNWDQICPFGPNVHFLVDFSHAVFVYLLSLIMVESFKKILKADSKI